MESLPAASARIPEDLEMACHKSEIGHLQYRILAYYATNPPGGIVWRKLLKVVRQCVKLMLYCNVRVLVLFLQVCVE